MPETIQRSSDRASLREALSNIISQVPRSSWSHADFKDNVAAKAIFLETPEAKMAYVDVALEWAWTIFEQRPVYGTDTNAIIEGMSLLRLVRDIWEKPLPYDIDGFTDIVRRMKQIQATLEPFYGIGGSLVTQAQAVYDREGATSLETLRPVFCEIRQLLSSTYSPNHQGSPYVSNTPMGHLSKLLDSIRFGVLERGEGWANAAINFLEPLSSSERAPWLAILAYASEAKAGKPNVKWNQKANTLLEGVTKKAFTTQMSQWLPQMGHDDGYWFADREDIHDSMLKGLIWMLALCELPPMARPLGAALNGSLKKRGRNNVRSLRVCNACLWALGQIDTSEAVTALMSARHKTKHGAILKSIEKAVALIAERTNVAPEDLEELAVPDYGLENGVIKHEFGEAHAEIEVSGAGVVWTWRNESGKEVKAPPASVKRDFGAELKELKTEVAELEKTLAAQKDRLDSLLRSEKTWTFATWHERYLEHPLMQLLARRVLWTFEAKGGTKMVALPTEFGFINAEGKEIEVPHESQVALWHPLFAQAEDVLAWRRYFEESGIKQPFKQAHREIYLLTEAERRTETYSNRFAAHIIKQHQFNSLCTARGWKNTLRLMVDDSYEPPTKEWPGYDIRAEFWVEGAGDNYGIDTNETGTYLRLATDQVRFYRLNAARNTAHAGGGGYSVGYRQAPTTPLRVEEVPPLVFSETMRDVDLFVGVASVGADPMWQDGGPNGRFRDYWHDYSFGELSESAKSRADVLSRLLPRLKIRDVAHIDGRFLHVQGKIRAYKIHLGSGNILMEPNDQYLCIVASRDPNEAVLLPFEGDRTLAVILSKAFLLAQDDKIKDETITRQIERT